MAIEIVDLPINSMVMFHSFLYVYQRVNEESSESINCQKNVSLQKHHVFNLRRIGVRFRK